MDDRVTFFPFWSTKEKSGAVSPTAKFSADVEAAGVETGAKADDPTRREENTAAVVNFIFDCIVCDIARSVIL